MPPPEQIQADASDSSPAVRITRHYLSELKNACTAKQVRFLAAYVPGQAELGEDDVTSTRAIFPWRKRLPARQAFDRIVRDLAIDAVDLMPPMVAAKCSSRPVQAHDLYATISTGTRAGHTVAAEVIAGAIDHFGVSHAGSRHPE